MAIKASRINIIRNIWYDTNYMFVSLTEIKATLVQEFSLVQINITNHFLNISIYL